MAAGCEGQTVRRPAEETCDGVRDGTAAAGDEDCERFCGHLGFHWSGILDCW
jgi:hypothetical protein